jgi:hypothetical protein
MPKIEQFIRFKDGTQCRLVDISYLEFETQFDCVNGESIEDDYERYKRESEMKELSDFEGYDLTHGIVWGAEIIVKVNGREFNPQF